MVEYFIMTLLQIYHWLCNWKNFENRSTFGEVTDKSIVGCFFDSQCWTDKRKLLTLSFNKPSGVVEVRLRRRQQLHLSMERSWPVLDCAILTSERTDSSATCWSASVPLWLLIVTPHTLLWHVLASLTNSKQNDIDDSRYCQTLREFADHAGQLKNSKENVN